MTALYGLASHNDGGTTVTGCAALDALLCPDVGEAKGCLQAACGAGLAALGRRLDAGFTALDGDELDLVLGGTAAAIDRNGDRTADALGSQASSRTSPGLWSGELRARGGSSAIGASWLAERVVP